MIVALVAQPQPLRNSFESIHLLAWRSKHDLRGRRANTCHTHDANDTPSLLAMVGYLAA